MIGYESYHMNHVNHVKHGLVSYPSLFRPRSFLEDSTVLAGRIRTRIHPPLIPGIRQIEFVYPQIEFGYDKRERLGIVFDFRIVVLVVCLVGLGGIANRTTFSIKVVSLM